MQSVFLATSMALIMHATHLSQVYGFSMMMLVQRDTFRTRPVVIPSTLRLSVSVEGSKAEPKARDQNLETKRVQFMYNQLKGNTKESQMRATAAENRVRNLQAKLKELEKQIDKSEGMDGNSISKADHDHEISSLMKKLNKARTKRDEIKAHSSKEISQLKESQEKDRLKWENEMSSLRVELNNANNDLKLAQTDLVKSHSDLENLRKEMITALENQKVQAQNEYDEIKSKLEGDLSEMRTEYEKQLATARAEIEELSLTLQTTKDDMTQQLFSTEKQYQAKLDDLFSQILDAKSRLNMKEKEVDSLEEERSSMRKLARLQLSLLKSRLKKRIQSIKGRS